ncbi:endonuclease/exonuclease/phosphatase family protein [Streptomyces sp. NPDC002666]
MFSKRPLGAAARITLPDDGTAEKRNLLCAPLADGTATRFCTTHITTHQSFNVARLESVRQKLEGYHTAGETVLIAGDFNAQPHYGRLNSFYDPGRHPRRDTAVWGPGEDRPDLCPRERAGRTVQRGPARHLDVLQGRPGLLGPPDRHRHRDRR